MKCPFCNENIEQTDACSCGFFWDIANDQRIEKERQDSAVDRLSEAHKFKRLKIWGIFWAIFGGLMIGLTTFIAVYFGEDVTFYLILSVIILFYGLYENYTSRKNLEKIRLELIRLGLKMPTRR